MTEGLALRDAVQAAHLSADELWIRYVGVGGTYGPHVLYRHLLDGDADPAEHNLIAVALNEYCTDHGQDHPVGYRDTGSALGELSLD